MLLQRAASNAYSWWWASHIRTTQSKWLDANLQEMEHRVKIMLKLLGEEADSFGKRAEMYYRTRPEVISHVEQVYRAYRALVERYDHLSKELHKANHTIATACPEQVQYAMLEEEDDSFPKAVMPIASHKIQKSTVQDILKRKREGSSGRNKGVYDRPAPRMTKDNAHPEISRLQKAILALQTEKEFVKSSYESGVVKYWEIEKEIADMQEEICHIQDEFDAHAAIEDDEARALMMMTALRSCQGMVSKLVENFEELIRVATIESEKTKSLQEKLYAMNCSIDPPKVEFGATNMAVNNRVYPITQAIPNFQHIYEKIEILSDNNYAFAEEMAEKVDELVDKVMNLELKFPKQYAQIKQLKEENEKLENKLDDLQDEMALRDDPSDMGEELKLVEDELKRMSILERSISEEEVLLSVAFSEVFSCIVNMPKAFGPIDPEEATTSKIPCIENITKDHTSNKGEESGDIATTPDSLVGDKCSKKCVSEIYNHDSPGGIDGIHDSRNDGEENIMTWSSLVQEEFSDSPQNKEIRDKESIRVGNHADLIVSLESENVPNETFEGKTDALPEAYESSSGDFNKKQHMGNGSHENYSQGEDLKGEFPPVTDSQPPLFHSESINTLNDEYEFNEKGLSMEVADSLFGSGNKTQGLTIDFDKNPVHRNCFIHDEHRQNSLVGCKNLHSFTKEDTTEENTLPEAADSCFSDADKGEDLWHADETKIVEELPKLGTSENMKGLNECSKLKSSEEGYGASLGCVSIIENLKRSVLVGAYSSKVSVKTSECVRNRDSEGTKGTYQLVSKEAENSEDMSSHISHSQLKRKNSDVKVLAREASNLRRHGIRTRHDKSGLFAEEDVPSWQEFLLDGLEGRDAILLADYTTVLQNYKETKRRLAELEKKNQEHLEETKAVIRELRNANSLKYVEIQSLRNLLDSSEMPPSKSNQALDREISIVDETNFSHTGAQESASPFELKFRTEIDALVEENLPMLVRYSMGCHCVQDLDRKYEELQDEMENSAIREPENCEKKMRELKTEVAVWFEQNALVGEDLQAKTTTLCALQEEIAEALRAGSEMDGARFTPYEAAKLQGEVVNMQQCNNKMESELQAALERMRELEAKVNDALRKLGESYELPSTPSREAESSSYYQKQFKHFPRRTRVPLRNFLFGTKPKKKSIFACINPALHKQFSGL